MRATQVLGWLIAWTAVVAVSAHAGQESAVPRFAVEPSPIALRGDVRPNQYLGVIGRRAAWLGKETGEAEIWVHPFKLVSGFRLDFRIPDYKELVAGADVARTVTVRPELTTITYTHATFTLDEHILAPLDEPGVLVLLDVRTSVPLEIRVRFQTVFQYAWPAGFGGQYTFWSEEAKAFVLSESLRKRNAVIGSPWAIQPSSHPAHTLPDAPNQFIIAVNPERIGREFIPIGVAAATAPREEVLALYRRLIGDAEGLYRRKRSHVAEILDGTTQIDTPDDGMDLAFNWSKINLDEAVACNPDLGCGLVAGWGPSGASTRPGFGWFFGGDAAINSFAMDDVGLWPPVAEGLRFLARYQREDGKIPHEITQAAAQIPWFTEFPYTYYHADTTPFWIAAVWRYWKATGDETILRDLWPAVRKAYAWCLTVETDGDGIIENTSGGLGAIEVGALGEAIHQDIYLAAVWIAALEAMVDMARFLGEDGLSQEVASLGAKARMSLNQKYWREEEGHHAFGILQSGRTNDTLTVWPATAAAFGLLDSPRAERTLRRLASDVISADWGARMVSTGSPLYDPTHYNNGAVWPFVTGFMVWGQYRYCRPWAAFPLVDALKQMSFDWARGRHPELLSGRFYRPLDTAVPQQFFATSMLITSVMQGMLGWEPDAARGRARLVPQIPPQWERMTVRGLRVGKAVVDVGMRQTSRSLVAEVEGRGPNVALELVLPVPLGAEDVRVRPSAKSLDDGDALVWIPVTEKPTRVEMIWKGGLRLELPESDLKPGQESEGVRVLDWRYDTGTWLLDLEGAGGREYEVKLHGERPSDIEGARLLRRDTDGSVVLVEFPPEGGRVIRQVRLSR